jgi:hypothetical protein
VSRRCKRRARPPPAPRDPRRPAEDALVLLRALGDGHVDLEHGRFVLAVAFMMTCPSLEDAQRLLAVVEEVHVGRCIDLHAALRR